MGVSRKRKRLCVLMCVLLASTVSSRWSNSILHREAQMTNVHFLYVQTCKNVLVVEGATVIDCPSVLDFVISFLLHRNLANAVTLAQRRLCTAAAEVKLKGTLFLS